MPSSSVGSCSLGLTESLGIPPSSARAEPAPNDETQGGADAGDAEQQQADEIAGDGHQQQHMQRRMAIAEHQPPQRIAQHHIAAQRHRPAHGKAGLFGGFE